MNKKYGIILSVVGVLIVIATWFLFSTPSVQAPTASDTQLVEEGSVAQDTMQEVSGGVEKGILVQYSSVGFSPNVVTIKRGDTVMFTSTDGSPMWVASAMHPSHTGYAGTTREEHCPDTLGVAFDQCVSGATYSFKFDKTGTWKYHNHVNASAYGTIIVQ